MKRLLTSREFDAIDQLATHDAQQHPILAATYAMLINKSEEAAVRRLQRMTANGLVTHQRGKRHSDPDTYQISSLGWARYQHDLAVMIGEPNPAAIPVVAPELSLVLDVMTLFHSTTTKEAA